MLPSLYVAGRSGLPRNGAPTRFACAIAAPWIVGTAIAFEADVAWLGYLLGGVLTAVATIVSVTHYCIPSMIYGFLFGRRGVQAVD